jgi:transcriptional regulator with XRE-family HTH domain
MAEFHADEKKRQERAIGATIGMRIRLMRMQLQVSQEKLANRLGLTFQQLQKYENGANRCSAARLVQIAGILGCPISSLLPPSLQAQADAEVEPEPLLALTVPQWRLIQNLNQLSSRQRMIVYAIARELAGRGDDPRVGGRGACYLAAMESADV